MEKPTKAPMWEEDGRSAHECCSGEVREALRERWRGRGRARTELELKEEGAD